LLLADDPQLAKDTERLLGMRSRPERQSLCG
jgi:hypothetical protein